MDVFLELWWGWYPHGFVRSLSLSKKKCDRTKELKSKITKNQKSGISKARKTMSAEKWESAKMKGQISERTEKRKIVEIRFKARRRKKIVRRYGMSVNTTWSKPHRKKRGERDRKRKRTKYRKSLEFHFFARWRNSQKRAKPKMQKCDVTKNVRRKLFERPKNLATKIDTVPNLAK